MWYFKEDKTQPLITAKEHISGSHGGKRLILPETAVLFFMHGTECIWDKYKVKLLSERFPRFLNACPVYLIEDEKSVCFLDGGRGAPQAADTLETLKELGVKNVVTVGMNGAFADNLEPGDILIPSRAYSEEGTSLHYYENIEYSTPDEDLFDKAVSYFPEYKTLPIVSTDAAYRQTFYKEALWREKGCAAVDMETSALFSVGRYLGLHIVSLLMVSDKHPERENAEKWRWTMTKEMRKELILKGVDFSLSI